MLHHYRYSRKHRSWKNGENKSSVFAKSDDYSINWEDNYYASDCWTDNWACYFDTNWRM